MTIHYSVKFENSNLSYHGEVDFKHATEDDIEGNEDSIVKACKRKLVTDCERWGFEQKSLRLFECYFYKNEQQIQIMKWEK